MGARTISMDSRAGRIVLFVTSLLFAGCASYQLTPLAASHPAHPEAASAPEPLPSQTLAYTRSDIPAAQPVSPVAAARQGASQTVVGEGEVIATVPSANQVVLEHGEIKGFMEAMTMGYRIDPPSLLAGLKPGDKVRFTIDVEKRTITEIEKLK